MSADPRAVRACLGALFLAALAAPAAAQPAAAPVSHQRVRSVELPRAGFTVSSADVRGGAFSERQESNAFGCGGQNLSPALSWRGAPAGTRSFAVTVFDPDAPTGSGFWHWIVYDIPSTVNHLPPGAGRPARDGEAPLLPPGAVQAVTDFGAPGFREPEKRPVVPDPDPQKVFRRDRCPEASRGSLLPRGGAGRGSAIHHARLST